MSGNRAPVVELQDRDRRLLDELAIMRVINREQAQIVAGFRSTTRANERLLALTRIGLLSRILIEDGRALYFLAGSLENSSNKQDLLEKIALKDKVEESREFATRIQSALFSASAKGDPRAKDRGIRKAPFVVLIGATMPSVLSEIGFISNAHDESIMKRSEYRERLAEALYKGLAGYANTLSHFQVAQRH
jgi:N-acetylmuramoyl-L-alanine amidase